MFGGCRVWGWHLALELLGLEGKRQEQARQLSLHATKLEEEISIFVMKLAAPCMNCQLEVTYLAERYPRMCGPPSKRAILTGAIRRHPPYMRLGLRFRMVSASPGENPSIIYIHICICIYMSLYQL